MLGITLAGLMVVAPMISSASDNSMGMTKSIEATMVVGATVADKATDEMMSKSIEATEDVGDQIEDKVTGLELGSNDYLEKPFDFKELVARLENNFNEQKDFSTKAAHELTPPLITTWGNG